MTMRPHLMPVAICAALLLAIQAPNPSAVGQARHATGRAAQARG